MAQFINTIQDVGKNYKKYDKWEQARADKMAQKEYLVQNGAVPDDKIELTSSWDYDVCSCHRTSVCSSSCLKKNRKIFE